MLYTRLAATPPTEAIQGLGYVDSRSPVLNVHIELDLPTDRPTSHGDRKKGSKRPKPQKQSLAIEVELAQNPTWLRSRKGDTGSVLWRVRYCSFRSMQLTYTERRTALHSRNWSFRNIIIHHAIRYLTRTSCLRHTCWSLGKRDMGRAGA